MYELSDQKLTGLLHHLWQNPAVLDQFDRIITDEIQQGIVESSSDTGNLRHYLPHHAVVWDAKKNYQAAHCLRCISQDERRALAERLHLQGAKFNQRILDILLRF